MRRSWQTIGILAVTQIISWGSLYYAFSILAPAIRSELRLSPTVLYGAFSGSILMAGLAAAPVGMTIDRIGGRWVMASGSLVCGVGLVWLSCSSSAVSYVGAWLLLGVGMALALYEAAFATITRRSGSAARQAISTLTLFAGFASTIFWPLTAHLHDVLDWRQIYLSFAALQLLVCLPLHVLLGRDDVARSTDGKGHAVRDSTLVQAMRQPAFWLLAGAFAANAFIFSAMSVHLIPLIEDLGHASRLAVLLAALIGPTQVAGRLLERSGGQKLSPQRIGILTFAGLPAALLVLTMFGSKVWAISLFCVLYGFTNGVLTILRGTLPQALFGSHHYGAISGAMAGPALLAKAAGPVVIGLSLGTVGTHAAMLWSMLALASCSYILYALAVRQNLNGDGEIPGNAADRAHGGVPLFEAGSGSEAGSN